MPKLSKDKMNKIKDSKGFTAKDVAALTGIPQSTIEKIFGGFNKNPTIDALQKIAKVLECGVDDFLDYEEEPVSPYSLDRQTGKLAQELLDNDNLRMLVSASKELSEDDIKAIIGVVNQLKKNTNPHDAAINRNLLKISDYTKVGNSLETK